MSKNYQRLALAALTAIGLCGCDEEKLPERHAEQRSGLAEVGQQKWLTPQDEVQPEVWLLAHEAKVSSAPASEDPKAVRRTLAEASAKFNDTPRMIANRAVQLEEMLKSEGANESAIILISRLNGAIAPGRIESFGAAGQQYYNMRKAGLSEAQAIDALSERYGSRG